MSESIVYNCDCMEYMKTLPDKAFDLAIVDPPYGDPLKEIEGGKKGSANASRGTAVHALHNFTTPGAKRRKPQQKELLSGF